MRRVGGICLILIGLFLASCGGIAQQAVEKTTGIQASQKGDAVTIKGADGKDLKLSSEAPAELKDFPVPSGMTLDGTGSMEAGGSKMSVANWKGKGKTAEVADFYKKNMPAKGWKEESVFTADDTAMLSYSKDSGESATITIAQEEDGTIDIGLLLGKNSKP